MRLITVEKYFEGRQETRFSVPAGAVRFAAGVLPRSARQALLERGIYIDEMVDFGTHDAPFSRWIEVEEKGRKKAIKLTVSG